MLRVFLRRGRQGLLSRAPVPRAVLLPESLRGLTPSAPALQPVSPAHGVWARRIYPSLRGARNPDSVRRTEMGRYGLSLRWNDFGRVNASSPRRDSVQPRPESLTPVHASAGSR